MKQVTVIVYRGEKREIKIKRKTKSKKKVILIVYILTINRRLPAFWPSILHLPACHLDFNELYGSNHFSKGHCLKTAHFFLKEAKLLLSKAICFSISMERMTNWSYTCAIEIGLLYISGFRSSSNWGVGGGGGLKQTLRIRVTGLEGKFSSHYGPQSCLKNKKGPWPLPNPLWP